MRVCVGPRAPGRAVVVPTQSVLTSATPVLMQFSCPRAEPFVGMAMILGFSEDNPQTGERAMVQLEGSDIWLPALVPMHAPRGLRRTTYQPGPVVGCLVENGSRFVLSWADIRCRSSGASFPAECDGASQRSVAIESAAAAILFVDSLTPTSQWGAWGAEAESRRNLGFGDPVSDHVKGRRTAVIVLMSPSDSPSDEVWNYGLIASEFSGSPRDWSDAVVRPQRLLHASASLTPPLTGSLVLTDDEGQRSNEELVVGQV